MRRLLLAGLVPLAFANPAAAATMDHMSMPGMTMPMPAAKSASTHAAKPSHGRRAVRARAARLAHRRAKREMTGAPAAQSQLQAAQPSGHDMAGMPMPSAAPTAGDTSPGKPAPRAATSGGMAEMPGMEGMNSHGAAQGQSAATPAAAAAPSVGEPEIPDTPPPPPPTDHAADRYYAPATMAASRAALRQEHGGSTYSKTMLNLAEYQARPGGGGYRWDAQASFGGDIDRFVLKSEGEGNGRGGVDAAEAQGLFSHAIGPYFDLQVGVRQDIRPRSRTYATVGVQGVAPYGFDVAAAVFVSTKGELLGRLEGTYDLRLTQRLILQPRAELNFAAQDTPETRTGLGLSNAELGLRLRYEIKREFAPYIGVSYDRKVGKTADYVRALGEDPAATSFVVGIRAWF